MVAPISMELGMVVSGIIYNDDYMPSALKISLTKVFKKHMERHGVKLFLLSLKNHFSIAETNSSKIAYTPTSGMVQQYRVPFLWRYPHQTTRPILLKMDLIGRPQVYSRIGYVLSEFFYMPPEVQDWPGRSKGAVYADESQRN